MPRCWIYNLLGASFPGCLRTRAHPKSSVSFCSRHICPRHFTDTALLAVLHISHVHTTPSPLRTERFTFPPPPPSHGPPCIPHPLSRYRPPHLCFYPTSTSGSASCVIRTPSEPVALSGASLATPRARRVALLAQPRSPGRPLSHRARERVGGALYHYPLYCVSSALPPSSPPALISSYRSMVR